MRRAGAALVGHRLAQWLMRACGFRWVAPGTIAGWQGDRAAPSVTAALPTRGARAESLSLLQ